MDSKKGERGIYLGIWVCLYLTKFTLRLSFNNQGLWLTTPIIMHKQSDQDDLKVCQNCPVPLAQSSASITINNYVIHSRNSHLLLSFCRSLSLTQNTTSSEILSAFIILLHIPLPFNSLHHPPHGCLALSECLNFWSLTLCISIFLLSTCQ